MRLAFKKLFESGPNSTKTGQHSAVIQEVEGKTATTAEGNAFWQRRDEGSALKSEEASSAFDSIGQRNETLREQLESIEFSFRDIEAIRTQFHHALTSIDQTLVEIERTKIAQLEANRKLEDLTAANTLADCFTRSGGDAFGRSVWLGFPCADSPSSCGGTFLVLEPVVEPMLLGVSPDRLKLAEPVRRRRWSTIALQVHELAASRFGADLEALNTAVEPCLAQRERG